MGLKVKLPMILYIGNKGAKDFANNWSIGGSTRHIEVKQYFLRELREATIVECMWKREEDMVSDTPTKTCARPVFENTHQQICWPRQIHVAQSWSSLRESVE
eukprot:1137497-Ditylum_brightwellii.AAC.1